MWAYVNSCSVLLFLAGGLDWFEGLGLLLGFGFGVVCGAVLSFNMGFTVGPYRGADVLGFSEQNSSHGVFVFEMEWGVSCSVFFWYLSRNFVFHAFELGVSVCRVCIWVQRLAAVQNLSFTWIGCFVL